MLENQTNIVIESGSEKSFGCVLGTVFALIGVYPLLHGAPLRLWAVGVSLCFFCLAILAPGLLKSTNRLWFKFGLALGAVIGPIVMAILYCLTVVPTGLVMRLLGKDLLRLKMEKEEASYWITRNDPVGSMKDQF